MGFVFSMWVCCICGFFFSGVGLLCLWGFFFFFSMWVCFALIDVGLLRLWDFFLSVWVCFALVVVFFLDGGGWWWLVVGVAVGLLG